MIIPSLTIFPILALIGIIYKSEALEGAVCAGEVSTTTSVLAEPLLNPSATSTNVTIPRTTKTPTPNDEKCSSQGEYAGEIRAIPETNLTYNLCADGTVTGHGDLSSIRLGQLSTLWNATIIKYTILSGFRCLFYSWIDSIVRGSAGPISTEEKGQITAYKCFRTEGLEANIEWDKYYGTYPTGEECRGFDEYAGDIKIGNAGTSLCANSCRDLRPLGTPDSEVIYSIQENFHCTIYEKPYCDSSGQVRGGLGPRYSNRTGLVQSYQCVRYR
jgi:hypothetical protein